MIWRSSGLETLRLRPVSARSISISNLTLIRAQELVSYDSETGVFVWKLDARRGSRRKGERAGRIPSSHLNYVTMRLDGRNQFAHRLAWLFMTGGFPRGEVDHINGDRHDNRWANLRLATRNQNSHNARRRADNSSGYKGVSYVPRLRKYEAYIAEGKRRLSLGCFEDPRVAHAVRNWAAELLHGDYARAG